MTSLNPLPPVRFSVAPLTLNSAARHLDTLADYLDRMAGQVAVARRELSQHWSATYRHAGLTAQLLRDELDRAALQIRTAQSIASHYEMAAKLRVISDKYTTTEERNRKIANCAQQAADTAVTIASAPLGIGGIIAARGGIIIRDLSGSFLSRPVARVTRSLLTGKIDRDDPESWLTYLAASGAGQDTLRELSFVLAVSPRATQYAASEAKATGRPLAPIGVARTAQALSWAIRQQHGVATIPATEPVQVTPVTQWGPHSGSQSLGDLIGGIAPLDPTKSGEYGLVEIRQHYNEMSGTTQWTVLIPGTQEQSMRATDHAWDNASNLALVSGDISAASAQVVLQAMEQAGIPPSDPVLLVGHSQGGLIAASLGGSAKVAEQFNVTGVVTAGAPVGAMKLDREVPQLHFEHDTDAILFLDGSENPALEDRVTVHRELGDSALEVDASPHSIPAYQVTAEAFTSSGHPEAEQWLSENGWALSSDRQTYVRRFQGSR